MYLFYVDESGTSKDPKQKFFILAGVSIFERQGYWLSSELDKIAAKFNPAEPHSLELHGNHMFSGKGIWRRFSKEDRVNAIKDVLKVVADSHGSNRLFASVINKDSVLLKDPVILAFEQLASRFDYYLQRLHHQNDTQRGIIIFDKSTYEKTIQSLATDFRTIGHSWGVIKNLAEVPLFLDSKASRLIQLADMIAYAIHRHYEVGDSQFYSLIENKFDSHADTVHGIFVSK